MEAELVSTTLNHGKVCLETDGTIGLQIINKLYFKELIMKKVNIIIALALSFMFGACSNEENYFEGETPNDVAPGTYYGDLLLSAEDGKDANMITRGGPDNSGFTNEYPYDYIYLHSADNLTKEEGHKVIRIPLKDVEYCDGCQGIHLEVTVLDNEEGYTIKNEVGDEIRLGNTDEVYFSTEPDTYWKPTILEDGGSPVSGRDVFIQDNNVNKELLRSVNDYDKAEIISLLQEGEPHIDMERHCTAFKTFFIFTDVINGFNGTCFINPNQWNNIMGGEQYSYEHFYIKLYIGPNFTDSYNVFSDNTDNAEGGFYVTNNQQYVPFVDSSNGGSGEIDTDGDGRVDDYADFSYSGFGYETKAGNYLISPLNTKIPVEDFSIYAFIKYTPDINQESDDFLTSDVGAKWFEVQIPRMTLETNTVHWITLAFDITNLRDAFNPSSANTTLAKTRNQGLPTKMELKYPVKIINIQQ